VSAFSYLKEDCEMADRKERKARRVKKVENYANMFLNAIQDYCKKMDGREMNDDDVKAVQLLDRKKRMEMIKNCPQEKQLIMEGHAYFVSNIKKTTETSDINGR